MSNAFHYQNTFDDELAQEFRQILSVGAKNASRLIAQPESPVAIYSLKQVENWQGDSIRIVNPDTLVESDIGFDANGYLDVAAVMSAMGASAYVACMTWYDQSGNGHHANAASTSNANRPRITGNTIANGKLGINSGWEGVSNGGWNMPMGVSADRSNCSVVAVYAPFSNAGQNGTICGFGSFPANNLALQVAAGKNGLVVLNDSFENTGVNVYAFNPNVIINRNNSINIRVDVNGVEGTGNAAPNGTFNGGQIGKWSWNSQYYSKGLWYHFAVYANGSIANNEKDNARDELGAAFNTTTLDAVDHNIVWIGDSLGEGTRASDGRNTIYHLDEKGLLNQAALFQNLSIFGQTLAIMDSSNNINPRAVVGKTNHLILQAATNDVSAGSTAATIFGLQRDALTNATDFQHRYIVTVPARNTMQLQTTNAGISSISRANPAVVTAEGHGLVDGAAIRINDGGGMSQVEGDFFIVRSPTANTFELQDIRGNMVDSTGFTAFSGAGDFDYNKEIQRLALNAMLLDATNQSTYNYQVIDWASTFTDATDLTYFDPDEVHFNNHGYATAALIVAPVINANLLGNPVT